MKSSNGVYRFAADGHLVMTYGELSGPIALDPSGVSFWAINHAKTPERGTSRVRVSDGSILASMRDSTYAGMRFEVRGGWRAALNGATAVPALSSIVLTLIAAALAVTALIRIR